MALMDLLQSPSPSLTSLMVLPLALTTIPTTQLPISLMDQLQAQEVMMAQMDLL